MKTIKLFFLILFFSLFTFSISLAQDITADTLNANNYYEKATSLYFKNKYDSCIFYLNKSNYFYAKHFVICKKNIAELYNIKGAAYYYLFNIDSSLYYYKKSLDLNSSYLDINDVELAKSNANIGQLYAINNYYVDALYYYNLSLNILIFNENENIENIARVKNLLGILYNEMGYYDKALLIFFEVLKIYTTIFEFENLVIANTYNNIGGIYWYKKEKLLATEYFEKSMDIKLNKYPTEFTSIIKSYINIGAVYLENNQFELALINLHKALEIINKEFPHPIELKANIINQIGESYLGLKNYDLALKYFFESLQIRKTLYGENNIDLYQAYKLISDVYKMKNNYENERLFLNKALHLFKINSIEKSPDLVILYNKIGECELINKNYTFALNYFQKAIYANLPELKDSCLVSQLPVLHSFFNTFDLINSINLKAKIFADTTIILPDIEYKERLETALFHFIKADSLILMRIKDITTQSDKLFLNEKANEIYKEAVDVCIDIRFVETRRGVSLQDEYQKTAFYFSERNKSSVLLQSLAGADALKYSGISQELLDKEHDLSIDIASLTNLKNNAENNSKRSVWESRLFDKKRSYDSLITHFETQYPEYYNLKYNNSTATVQEIQNLFDKKTAMLSYSISDKYITIFAISKKDFYITRVPLPDSLDIKIYYYRSTISDADAVYDEMKNDKNDLLTYYQEAAYDLYSLLFPTEITNLLDKNKIENLIIIPDGDLAKLPFETLFTEKYTATWTNWQNKTYFSEMPYLIKKYNISYNYSATLFVQIEKNKQNNKNITMSDWVGFAPVFDDKKTAATNQNSQQNLKNDSFLNGKYICPLPSTKIEVQNIFDIFIQNNKNAKIYTHQQANEKVIKSDEISNYKIIHIASHGFTNEFKPELSAVLLAQDTTACTDSLSIILGNVAQQNEGFLYQSEIYNLKFNADLVVLSACETGLGKVSKGEGVIGLTRAFLYAGADNLIVSLWQVSDKATQLLMVDFYKNYLSLNKKKQKKFAPSLRNAKLEMIKQGFHPYLWSSFILIGE